MKLPRDAVIAPEKVRDYLLVPRPENDKAAFFGRAGYDRQQWHQLSDDLRSQILPLDAGLSRRSVFGDYYTVDGRLVGPNTTTRVFRSRAQ